ncbi:MAG TPA: hypothetical protein VGU71_00515 [Candidatus Dormibacteraeota bacterium]|nr:hypothetical protein [Candidatus Dormibacteraeota bacterium]
MTERIRATCTLGGCPDGNGAAARRANRFHASPSPVACSTGAGIEVSPSHA